MHLNYLYVTFFLNKHISYFILLQIIKIVLLGQKLLAKYFIRIINTFNPRHLYIFTSHGLGILKSSATQKLLSFFFKDLLGDHQSLEVSSVNHALINLELCESIINL